MALKHAFVSPKVDGTDTTLVRPSNWNDDHVVDTDGLVIPVSATKPASPSAGSLRVYGKSYFGGNKQVPVVGMPDGTEVPLQIAGWSQKTGHWYPMGYSYLNVYTWGIQVTLTGNQAARANLSFSSVPVLRRIGQTSATSIGSVAGYRGGWAPLIPGNGTGSGGFLCVIRFLFSDAAAVTGARAFIGVQSATGSVSNADPVSQTNSFGIVQTSGDATQLYLFSAGTSAQTPVPLGTGFPPYIGSVGENNGVPYELAIRSRASQNGVFSWVLTRLDTGAFTSGTVTPATPGVQTPSNTTPLTWSAWRNNNTSSLAVGLDSLGFYFETDS